MAEKIHILLQFTIICCHIILTLLLLIALRASRPYYKLSSRYSNVL